MCGKFFVHRIPRQHETQHVVQKIQQQKLNGRHREKRQADAGRDDGHDVPEIGRSRDADVLRHVHECFAPLADAFFQNAEILVQQDHVRSVAHRLRGALGRNTHIGFPDGGQVVHAVAQKTDGVAVVLQHFHDVRFLTGRELREHGRALNGRRELIICERFQFPARHDGVGGDADSPAHREGNTEIVSGEQLDRNIQAAELFHRLRRAALGHVEEREISEQREAVRITRSDARLGCAAVGDGEHFHAVLPHFVHHGGYMARGVGRHGFDCSAVVGIPAQAVHFVHAALDDEKIFVPVPDQNTGKALFIIERRLVQLGVALRQSVAVRAAAGKFTEPKNSLIEVVLHPRVVQAVEICVLPRAGALVAENVGVVFQTNLIARQSARLVQTQHVHAAESLHGVDAPHDRVFAPHDGASTGETRIDDHREHFGRQPHRDGKGKQESLSPVSLRQPACQKDERNQNGHEADEHPCDRICAAVESLFAGPGGQIEPAEYGENADCRHNALAGAADDGGTGEHGVREFFEPLRRGGGHAGALFQNVALAREDGL